MDVTASHPRHKTRQIMVGAVPVGGDAPITVQSMTTTKTADVEGTLQQIYDLAMAGCDIVRCTRNEPDPADALPQLAPPSPLPIIAAIHHHHRIPLAALAPGAPPPPPQPGHP